MYFVLNHFDLIVTMTILFPLSEPNTHIYNYVLLHVEYIYIYIYIYIYSLLKSTNIKKEITNVYTTADGSPYYC